MPGGRGNSGGENQRFLGVHSQLFKLGRNAATVNDPTLSHAQPSLVLAGRRLSLPSWRTLGIAAGVVLAVALLGAAAWFWNASQQQRGSAVFAEVLTRHRVVEGPQATPEMRAAAMRDLERVLAEYPSNVMVPQAAFLLGNLRYGAGQFDRARAAYQVTVARSSGGTMVTLARAGLGYAWEGEKKYPEATQAFEAALAGLKPTSFYYEELLFDLARAQERSAKKDAAIATYRRMLRELPRSPRAPEIRTRLATLGATP
jgi:tetratricopeptide (TPR) repeat protein